MADGNKRYKSDKKVYKVSFKLSEMELLKLESDAKKAGKNRSEYLRELVKNSKGVDTTFATDRSSFIRQITGIATNVNQIAKVVNTQGFACSSDINGIKRNLEDIKRLMQEVLVTWQSLTPLYNFLVKPFFPNIDIPRL